MEKLLEYCDTDDSEDEQLSMVSSGAKKRCVDESTDYFSLHCSSDDEVFDDVHQSSLDTVINSYQLSKTVVGPQNIIAVGASTEKQTPQKISIQTKRKKRLSASDNYSLKVPTEAVGASTNFKLNVEEEDFATAFSSDELFKVYPLIERYSAAIPASSLPHEKKRTLLGHCGCVNTLSWGLSTNNAHLLLSTSMDGTIKIWNPLTSRTNCLWSRSLHTGAAIRCARWSPSSNLIASVGYDKAIRIFDVEKDSEVFVGFHSHVSTCLTYHPETPDVILTGNFGSVDCWDMRKSHAEPARHFQADFNEVQDIEFLHNGREFICCSNFVSRDSSDKAIIAWDFTSGAVLSNQIFNERYHCTCLRIHPSQKWFLAQTNGNYIALFSTTRPYKMNKKKRFEGHRVEGYWIGMSISPDGHYLYSGSANGFVCMYDFYSGHLKKTLRASGHPCLAVECHPVLPNVVVASSWTGEIIVFQ